MPRSTATRDGPRQRPLSPHLQVYRLIPTMLMSIVHRMTGSALYFGTLLLAAWLVAAAASPQWFDALSRLYGSWLGLLVLFAYTWALIHHMAGGVRHLIWDTGTGIEKESSTRIAIATPFISIGVTILVWIAAYLVQGG